MDTARRLRPGSPHWCGHCHPGAWHCVSPRPCPGTACTCSNGPSRASLSLGTVLQPWAQTLAWYREDFLCKRRNQGAVCVWMCKYIWCHGCGLSFGTRCPAEIPLYCLGEGMGVLSSFNGVSISVRDDCMCLRDALFPVLLVRVGKCERVAQGGMWRLWHTWDQPVPGNCLVCSV